MSAERNGVTFFDSDKSYDDHPAMRSLSKVSLGDVRFPFGFFLVDEGGKTQVVPATKDEWLKTMAKAFPKIDAATLSSQDCHPNGTGVAGCHGGCGKMSSGFFCRRWFNSATRQYGCGCVDMS